MHQLQNKAKANSSCEGFGLPDFSIVPEEVGVLVLGVLAANAVLIILRRTTTLPRYSKPCDAYYPASQQPKATNPRAKQCHQRKVAVE
jgi:hypothetical protein